MTVITHILHSTLFYELEYEYVLVYGRITVSNSIMFYSDFKIAKRIDKNTQPSAENNFAEYLLNVAGDITGDILMQGINK